MGGKSLDTCSEGSGPELASRGKLSPGPGLPPKQVAESQLARLRAAATGIVAEHGYGALKVRDVVRHAEVSTRAFYEHFSSKEDCFLWTYDSISRRATRRLVAAQAGERDWRQRARLVFEEFAGQIEREPDAARLVLLEAYNAGDATLVQVWQAERNFERMLAECFARTPRGVVVPPLVVEGMVAGIAGVAKGRLRAGKVKSLSESADQLIDWALGYVDPVAAELAGLDRETVWRDTALEPLPPLSLNGDSEPRSSPGDRSLILEAVCDLAAANGYTGLTVPRIRSAAGVSRRKFDAYFDGLEDCYLAALEQRVGEAMAKAARAQTAARSPQGGVYRAIVALCDHVAGDDFLVRVCLTGDFPPGPDGLRSRRRLIDAIVELLADGASDRSPLASEASAGALWSLFHHYVIRDWALRRQISATLGYLALAPAVGASAAVEWIKSEQGG